MLDAKQIQHRMHLSLDTIEAPPGAVGQTICAAADAVDAQLVIVGHNRQPVGNPSPPSGKAEGATDQPGLWRTNLPYIHGKQFGAESALRDDNQRLDNCLPQG